MALIAAAAARVRDAEEPRGISASFIASFLQRGFGIRRPASRGASPIRGPAGCAAHRAGNVRDPTGGRLLTCGDHMEAIPVLASGDHLEVRGWDRVNRAPSRAGVEKRK